MVSSVQRGNQLFIVKCDNLFFLRKGCVLKNQHFLHLSVNFILYIFSFWCCFMSLFEGNLKLFPGFREETVFFSPWTSLELPGCDACHFLLLTGIVEQKSFSTQTFISVNTAHCELQFLNRPAGLKDKETLGGRFFLFWIRRLQHLGNSFCKKNRWEIASGCLNHLIKMCDFIGLQHMCILKETHPHIYVHWSRKDKAVTDRGRRLFPWEVDLSCSSAELFLLLLFLFLGFIMDRGRWRSSLRRTDFGETPKEEDLFD